MKVIAKSAVILIAAALGVMAGFAFRAKHGLATSQSELVQQGLPVPALGRDPASPANGDSSLAAQLQRDLAASSGVTRWLCWLQAIEKATPSDFPRLALLAKDNPAALQFIAARWVQIAPRHFFDSLVTGAKTGRAFPVQQLANVLFQEWPKLDPEAAIAALNQPGNSAVTESWRHQVATAVIKNDVERGLRLFSDWGINNYLPFSDGRGPVPQWAAADPRHAAEFALEHPCDYLSQPVMQAIGEQWAKTDPAAALQFAAGAPGQLGSALGGAALKTWAAQDLDAAADWLGSASAAVRNRLSPGFVEAWAKTDAAGALGWCQENLSGSALSRAATAVVQGAGVSQVGATAALVAAMDPSAARADAALAVARQWFPSLGGMAGPAGNQTVAPETVAWLSSLDPLSIKRVLDDETWQWATSDPASMASFLLSVTNPAFGDWPETCLARQMAGKDPAGALSWAARLPGNDALVAGGAAYAEWRNSQPDPATQWLDNLPEDDPRRQSFFQAAIRLLAYNPQAPEQLATMSPQDQATARQVIEGMTSLPADRRARLLAAVTK